MRMTFLLSEEGAILAPHQRLESGASGTTRCPRTDTPCSASTASQPSRVPMVLVAASRPMRSSRAVRRAKRARDGWSSATNSSFRCSTGGILGARVVAEVEVEPLQIGDDSGPERRMGDAVEVLVGEIRHARAPAKELDERQTVDGAGELAAAAFVDRATRAADARPRCDGRRGRRAAACPTVGVAARPVHGVLVAGGEQEGVGFCAAGPVRPEEGADVVP